MADKVAWRNPKVDDRSYDPVVLEEWIRGMENVFTVVEVPEEKKMNIRTYYLLGEVGIWWNTMKDKLLGPKFTSSKFLAELRANFTQLWCNGKRRRNL